jgi:hypothetical protein
MRSFIGVSLFALLIGCGSDDADGVFVTASWSLRSVNANTPLPCPAMYPVTALNVRALDDAACNADGDLLCTTPLACDDRMGTSNKLLPGMYEVWIDITSGDGTSVYATTFDRLETIDLTLGDKPFARQILIDGGVFKYAWRLPWRGSAGWSRRRSSLRPPGCWSSAARLCGARRWRRGSAAPSRCGSSTSTAPPRPWSAAASTRW